MSASAVASTRPTTRTRQAVAANVRAAAARHQLGRDELATRLGVSPTTMSRRLNGHQPFNVDELERLAEVLDVDVAELMTPPRRPPTGADAAATQPTPRGGTHARPQRTAPR